MKFTNFGSYYYPSPAIAMNLAELIVFTENATKNGVPNGSVLVYNETHYNPSILQSDVGCGITAVITDEIPFNRVSTVKEVMRAVDELDVHIGQGNHFIDFTTAHPAIKGEHPSHMVYLHTDFNNENVVPKTYDEAKQMEHRAQDQRKTYLERLTTLLGISSEFYRDWTHNTVNQTDDVMIYRKGAINLQETDGVGVLAMNPLDGLYLYAGDFQNYHSSAQHGLGRKGSKGELFGTLTKTAYGIARGYQVPTGQLVQELDELKNDSYHGLKTFTTPFILEQTPIGVCVPELVVTTKKSRSQ